jgi:hypothetical protein
MTEPVRLFRMFDRYDILARITPGLLAPLVPGFSLLIAFPQIVPRTSIVRSDQEW